MRGAVCSPLRFYKNNQLYFTNFFSVLKVILVKNWIPWSFKDRYFVVTAVLIFSWNSSTFSSIQWYILFLYKVGHKKTHQSASAPTPPSKFRHHCGPPVRKCAQRWSKLLYEGTAKLEVKKKKKRWRAPFFLCSPRFGSVCRAVLAAQKSGGQKAGVRS